MPGKKARKTGREKNRLTLDETVFEHIRGPGLLARGDRVLVALSGGPDSTCLFHLLLGLRARLEIECAAAHLDHGMRPESARDADFCRRICAGSGVDFFPGKAELGPAASEALARRARYEFLGATASQNNFQVIATAHNLDDQAETILLRLLRGTGLQGLSGILPRREMSCRGKRLKLVRPLLRVPREEIEKWLALQGLESLTDPTNEEGDYLRNRLRKEVMPRFLEYNPSFREGLARLAETAAEDYDFIGREGARILAECALPPESPGAEKVGGRENTFIFQRREFGKLHPAIQREALRRAMSTARGGHYRPGFEQVEQARKFLLSGTGRFLRPAPGIVIERREKTFQLGNAEELKPAGWS